MEPIKVAADSPIPSVSGSIAKTIREHHQAEALAIGAGAVHQVLKALILANKYLKNDGIQVGFVPEWAPITIENRRGTTIKFSINILTQPNLSSDHGSDSIGEA